MILRRRSQHAAERNVTLPIAVRAAGAAKVTIAGEMEGWEQRRPVSVTAGEDGLLRGSVTLRLPPGVYAWKPLVDGVYCLDPGSSRTRTTANGHKNHVLSVGGAPEPLLFAPGSPWIFEESGGGVRVTAGLRRGAGRALAVVWREPADEAEHTTPMDLAAEEPEHLLFHARLPISSGRASIGFVLPDGTTVGSEESPGRLLSWEAPADTTPAWWRRAVVYTVFVDRFRPRTSSRRLAAEWARDPGPGKLAGGHLDGVTEALPALAEIGVTALYLTPLHTAASCHRYDMVAPGEIDPRLGGEAAFQRLLSAAHDFGIRIIVDFTCSHAGRGFNAYEDVLAHGRESRYARWFQWKDAPAGGREDERESPALRCYGSRSDAPLFDLGEPEVQAFFVALARAWAERGADGLRLDAADEVPSPLAREIRGVFREIRPDGVVLGETIGEHTYRFLGEEAGDAVTEMGFQGAIGAFLAEGTIPAEVFLTRVAEVERARGAPAHRALRFLSTHDLPRFATIARTWDRAQAVPIGLVALFTLPGTPMLLYGEEVGLAAMWPEHLAENVWPDRMPMPWREDRAVPAGDSALRELVKDLASLRRSSPSLLDGEVSFLRAEGGVLVYRRARGGDVLDVALNVGPAFTWELGNAGLSAESVLSVGPAALAGDSAHLGPFSALVVRRRPRETRRLALAGTPALRDRDFTGSAIVVKSRPSRLDLAVTERCNLRCAHCITHAPERTLSRSARTMSPWLVDRLRDDLAHAEYFAFVHGGESLVTPMFDSLLAAIRESRCGLPAMIHVLTNGMALAPETVSRLARGGVRSLSVSLDGATADVNDAVRVGGRFATIVDHVRAAVRLRREQRLDLRIGVSSVVLAQNAGDLGAMVDLCLDLGVDWLKLEEAVPSTAFAARSLVRLDEGPFAEAVAAACERARRLGLTIVDHTVDRPLWRCRLDEDPAAAARLGADSFANRTRVHPCRAAWEIACIEANGDVRIGHFFGPVLGNVAEARLSDLWNGPLARSARQGAVAERLCRAGPVTCAR